MHIKEISDKIEICAYCPLMCQDICTVYYETKNQATSPTLQNYLLYLISEGKEKYSKDVAELIYECCCNCLLCQSWCNTNQDVPEKIRAARRDIVDLKLEPKAVTDLNKSTIEEHNPYNEAHENRFKKITSKPSNKEKGADILYFTGCTAAYRQPETANAVVTILEKADITFNLMNGEEWCCGLPQWELGLNDTAKKLAEHNADHINNSKCKSVLTSCPECYFMLKEVYPSLGFPIKAEIVHISEYLNSLITDGKLKLKGSMKKKITFHDPCYLGRHAKIYDAPREVIKNINGAAFTEMRWIKEKAYCCGGNEGYAIVNPEISSRIGKKVIEEAEKVEAEVLVTSCPLCKELLSKNVKEKNIEVYELSELIIKIL